MEVWIPYALPGLNEFIAANRKHRMAGAALKKKWTGLVSTIIRTSKQYRKFEGPVFIRFDWYEKNRRRDPDNIAGGGRKIILDALVDAGVLPNDGWKATRRGWRDRFVCEKGKAGVQVCVQNGTNVPKESKRVDIQQHTSVPSLVSSGGATG